MTIEEVLGMDAAELSSYDDATLLAWFQPKLEITRPTEELRASNKKKGTQKASGQLELLTASQIEERKQAVELARQLGVNIEDILQT